MQQEIIDASNAMGAAGAGVVPWVTATTSGQALTLAVAGYVMKLSRTGGKTIAPSSTR